MRNTTEIASAELRRHVLALLAKANLVPPEAQEADALADLRRRELGARSEPRDRQALQIIASGRRLLGEENERGAGSSASARPDRL